MFRRLGTAAVYTCTIYVYIYVCTYHTYFIRTGISMCYMYMSCGGFFKRGDDKCWITLFTVSAIGITIIPMPSPFLE